MATRLPPHKALHIRLDADPASSFRTMPAHPRGGTLISVTWLRREPLVAAVVFAVPTALQAAFGGFLTQDTTVGFLAAMLLLYSIGRYAEWRTFRLALPLVVAGGGIALVIESGLERSEYFFWLACL